MAPVFVRHGYVFLYPLRRGTGSARSWPVSPPLRARLEAAASRTVVPVFFLFAANDYSVTPGRVLAADMERLGKPHLLTIYPPVGRTSAEGHSFVHLRISAWEQDVFAFLASHMK